MHLFFHIVIKYLCFKNKISNKLSDLNYSSTFFYKYITSLCINHHNRNQEEEEDLKVSMAEASAKQVYTSQSFRS